MGSMYSSTFIHSTGWNATEVRGSVAAGQNTTFFVAVPGGAELPRHPEEVDHPELCVMCSQDLGEDVLELECEKVGSSIVR